MIEVLMWWKSLNLNKSAFVASSNDRFAMLEDYADLPTHFLILNDLSKSIIEIWKILQNGKETELIRTLWNVPLLLSTIHYEDG